jgi:hypothetical protein
VREWNCVCVVKTRTGVSPPLSLLEALGVFAVSQTYIGTPCVPCASPEAMSCTVESYRSIPLSVAQTDGGGRAAELLDSTLPRPKIFRLESSILGVVVRRAYPYEDPTNSSIQQRRTFDSGPLGGARVLGLVTWLLRAEIMSERRKISSAW